MMELNGLTPAEFLRPFGEVGNLSNYVVKTIEKNEPYKLEKFRINFVDSHRMQCDSKDNARIVERIFQTCRPQTQDNALKIPKKKFEIQCQLLNLLGASRVKTEQQRTPWFTMWKKQFYQSVRYPNPPYELTHQPICFIYFLSVEDADPLSTIESLRSPDSLPAQYRSGMYDNSKNTIKQFVFILNDTADERKFQDTVSAVKGQFDPKSILEIPMSGHRLAKIQPQGPPIEDKWNEFLDIDLRHFDSKQVPKGQAFTQNDRTISMQVVRRIIEKYLLPFAIQKIQTVEPNVRRTRTGGFNRLKNFFKESERGDNDGLKNNFKMNRNELELRNLIDLAFVIQDYQTTRAYVDFPAEDFRKIKAFQHAAHCDELRVYSRLCLDRDFATSFFKDFISATNSIYDSYYKVHNDQNHSIIKSTLMMIEVYQQFEKYQESSSALVRIANVIPDRTVLKPLLYEQASYDFLMQQQFRKAALYMSMAAQGFEKLGLKHHAFNCYAIIHPFYHENKGWNEIRLKTYSSLSEMSKDTKVSQELAVQYFKNLLELSPQFNDLNQQRKCLNTCFVSFGKFQQDKNENDKGNIGQLQLPQILPHTVEVFTDSEKVFTNFNDSVIPPMNQAGEGPNNLFNGKFLNFSGKKTSASQLQQVHQQEAVNKKSDLNQNNILWRFLDKKITTFMKKHHSENLQEDAYAITLDQMTEQAIYDAQNLQEKEDVIYKKERKVYAGRPITVRMIMRNPLMTEIQINKVSLVCKYKQENSADIQTENDFISDSNEYKIGARSQIEVILNVVPTRSGLIVIEKVHWELLGLFRCEMPFVKLASNKEVEIPKQLLIKEKTFHYKVLPQSVEIQAQIKMKNDFSNLVYTETDSGELKIKNMSETNSIKNLFVICSHPIIFGFKCKPVAKESEIGPNQEVSLPLDFRATQIGQINVRFLIRYEVADLKIETASTQIPTACKYRFQRLILFLNCNLAFKLLPQVYISMKENDKYQINFQIQQKINASWYDRPRFTSIELVRGQENWRLSRMDEVGNFVTISTKDLSMPNKSILVYKKESDDLINFASIKDEEQSILLNGKLMNLFKLEVKYIEHIKQMSMQVEPEIGVDVVIRWQMTKRNSNKQGFFAFIGLKILNQKLALTETQQQLNHQYKMNQLIQAGVHRKTKKDAQFQIKNEVKQINPVQVTYKFDPLVHFDFVDGKTAIVPLTISIQNLLQTSECIFDCQIIAKTDQKDSENKGFVWIGKTSFQMKNFKPNESRLATLKAGIFREGIYNLNMFEINIKQHTTEAQGESANTIIVSEVKLKDLMMVSVVQKSRIAQDYIADKKDQIMLEIQS